MLNDRLNRTVALAAGIGAIALALTPSLVPRPAMFQGFLAGLSFALVYLGMAWLMRHMTAFYSKASKTKASHRTHSDVPEPAYAGAAGAAVAAVPASAVPNPTRTTRSWGWWAMGGAGVLYVVMVGTLAIGWQNEVRSKVEMPPVDGLELMTFFVVAVATSGVVFGARWGLLKMASLGRFAMSRVTPRPRILKLGGLVTGALSATLALTLLVSAALLGTDRVYAARNDTTPPGIAEPSSTNRSAGTASAVQWDKLGMQGRAFVGGGPTVSTIEQVTGQPAMEPIRVYVGSAQEKSMDARADLAVAELKRTGGFERATLMIATPTGSGWLERQSVDALEYLHGGDTAIVSMQYSYQPSWVSFLFHQDLPRDSGQALYNAVKTEWLSLPEGQRPRLLVYGLSLGASGMQSAFASADELISSVDGAVFSGAPNNSQPWGTLQASRDAGSPPWQPVYDDGRHIRWMSKTGDFDRLPSDWAPERVAYLQHGTDAVTWLTPRLIWERPDWLGGSAASGGRAPDVSDSMRWIPLVTYLQVAFDMFMGEAVPASHGHNFGDVAVAAWNGVAPGTLDQAALARVQDVIASYPFEDSMDN